MNEKVENASKAMSTILQGIEKAQQNGVYSLAEADTLIKSMNFMGEFIESLKEPEPKMQKTK